MPTSSTNRKNARKAPAKKAAAKKTTAKKSASSAPKSEPVEDAFNPHSSGGDDKYAASSWGQTETGGVTDLQVPSGQLCLVKRPGVEGLLREGVLRDMDSFTQLVSKEHIQRVKGKGKSSKPKKAKSQEDEIAELLEDPQKVANVMHTMDRVICHVVIKPDVKMTPNDPTSRKKGVIYADMIDLIDKLFIFQFVVGGSRDIDRFLDESEIDLGDLAALQAAPGSA